MWNKKEKVMPGNNRIIQIWVTNNPYTVKGLWIGFYDFTAQKFIGVVSPHGDRDKVEFISKNYVSHWAELLDAPPED